MLMPSSPRLSQIAEMWAVRFGLEHVGECLLVVHAESLLLRDLHTFGDFLVLYQLSEAARLLPPEEHLTRRETQLSYRFSCIRRSVIIAAGSVGISLY